jgi:hypothetical protein
MARLSIDWIPGSENTLTAAGLLNEGIVTTWDAIWNSGQMTYTGDDHTTLGSWTTVTSPGGLDGIYAFAFDDETGTLSLAKSPDNDGDGVADTIEMLEFQSLSATDGSIDSDGDGVIDFFEYLYGSSMTDAFDGGFYFTPFNGSQAGGVSFIWTVRDGIRLNEDYAVHVSTNLRQWNELPADHYALTQVSNSGKTEVSLEMTHDYGRSVFFKLTKPVSTDP